VRVPLGGIKDKHVATNVTSQPDGDVNVVPLDVVNGESAAKRSLRIPLPQQHSTQLLLALTQSSD